MASDVPARRPEPTIDLLVAGGLLTDEQAQTVLRRVYKSGERAEDVVVELQIASEPDLLKTLAQHFRTQFVTTPKMAAAEIAPQVLGLVPPELAEQRVCIPLVFDARANLLLVATADPDDLGALKEVQAAARVREVRPCLARPATVRAAIQRWYHGNLQAFARVDQAQFDQFQGLMDQFERNVIDRVSSPSVGRERELSEEDLELEREASQAPAAPAAPAATATQKPSRPLASTAAPAESMADVGGLLNVLVSLHESSRAELRGHSPMAARLCRRLAERMDLSVADREAIVTGAYLHDLGKTAQYHLTTLNVSEYEGHRVVAAKTYLSPVRMFEGVRLPRGTLDTVEFMYERVDGRGLPGQRRGADIPLGARVLAVVDTYADLLVNPRNPFRKTLGAAETFEAMSRYRDKIFDGNILDLFRLAIGGEDLRQRLLAERPTVLVVDPDPEQTTILELRLLENDFDVRIARSADQAFEIASAGQVDVVVCEVALDGFDGFELIERLQKADKARDVPFVFLTARAAREDISRGFELGASDYMIKPTAAEVLVAKLRKLLQGRSRGVARGVSGSLREMALPDIVQILFHGRKSGLLKLRSPKGTGEIHFDGGWIVNAGFGKQGGEEAFYAMLELADGDFLLDPNVKPTTKRIEVSPEMLLLEGLRRLDEAKR